MNNSIKEKKNLVSEEFDDKDYVYESLRNTISKYHLCSLPQEFNNILNMECFNINCGISNISVFISYYYKIFELKLDAAIKKAIREEKEKLEREGLSGQIEIDERDITIKTIENFTLSVTEVFQQTDVYSASSNVYSLVLGPKDAMYIKTNPAPLPAKYKIKNDRRLKEAVEWTKKNFERTKVTIPTFNEILEVNGKKIRSIVGNFTAPYNVTHGERTEACMRIGGEGESLFDFCLSNKNAFHITFETEEGEYLSRVSGFRNGNTVFLNELRETCIIDSFSNEDVVDVTKKTANLLIELSKNSTCPIENVVVTRRYATQYIPDKDVVLNVDDIKAGIGAVYSDINQNCIVLATTSKNEDFVPVNLDNSKVPEYLVAREAIQTVVNDDTISKINRIHAVKSLLNGTNLENVTPIVSDLEYAYVGGDWFICMDSEGTIYEDCIDIHPKAREEFFYAKGLFMNQFIKEEEKRKCV